MSVSQPVYYTAAILWTIGCFSGDGLATGAVLLAGLLCVLDKQTLWSRGALVALLVFGASVAWAIFSCDRTLTPIRPNPLNSWVWLAFPIGTELCHRLSFKHIRTLGWLSLGVASLSSLFALFQHSFSYDYALLSDWLPVHRVSETVAGKGLAAGGFHFHRLKFAHTLIPFMICWVYFGWSQPKHKNEPAVMNRMLLIASFVLCGIGLWCTHTRASWLGLGVGLLCLILYQTAAHFFAHPPLAPCVPREMRLARARHTLCGTGLRYTFSSLAFWLTLTPILSLGLALWCAFWLGVPADRSLAWRAAIQLWWQEPWFGIGVGNYPAKALALWEGPHPHYVWLHFDSHHLLWQVLVERGVLGSALLVGLAIWFLRRHRVAHHPGRFALVMSVFALGFVHNLVDHTVVIFTLAWVFALMGSDKVSRDRVHAVRGQKF